jgi:tellurite resistance protein TerC
MVNIQVGPWSWLVLGAVVAASLAVDLVMHRGGKRTGRKQAAAWSAFWVALAVVFGGFVVARYGARAGGEYFAAWLLEKSLSVDNLFVVLVVFQRLKIGEDEQHRVLFWGILGALVTRGAFIAGGTAMLAAWHGTLYVMGAFLVFTGARTALEKPEKESRILDFFSRHLPLTKQVRDHRFLVREDGRLRATPLLLALVVIEITDIVFAVDSIPAVLAISEEPFIVYASNVFAVLGLRALYLLLAAAVARLRYLRFGLGAILVLVGAKMLLSRVIEIPPLASLAGVGAILASTVGLSLLARRRSRRLQRPLATAGGRGGGSS